jgi:hypothetical protein
VTGHEVFRDRLTDLRRPAQAEPGDECRVVFGVGGGERAPEAEADLVDPALEVSQLLGAQLLGPQAGADGAEDAPDGGDDVV